MKPKILQAGEGRAAKKPHDGKTALSGSPA